MIKNKRRNNKQSKTIKMIKSKLQNKKINRIHIVLIILMDQRTLTFTEEEALSQNSPEYSNKNQ